MIDLDNFKHINDRAGHGTGDVALRTVAESLKAELRAVDNPARFGGETASQSSYPRPIQMGLCWLPKNSEANF